MRVDFEKIRNDPDRREKNLQNSINIIKDMYVESAHFIYEILQNADDAGATKIFFKLNISQIEINHNGRLFNEDDVNSINNIGDGTKKNDLSKIGKFGIGFKAVYKYTKTPEIHSGDNHFMIKNYIDPEEINIINPLKEYTTLFILPFNNLEEKTKEKSFLEIEKRLNELNIRSIMFLKYINLIEFEIENNNKGFYKKTTKEKKDYIDVKISEKNKKGELTENWIVFREKAPHPDNKNIFIEVAYKIKNQIIDRKKKKKKHKNKKIKIVEKINKATLFVYFSTRIETHLGFILQGPFDTTKARDNIVEDSEWNKKLIESSGNLIVKSLYKMKEYGFMGIELLNTLPIDPENFPPNDRFYPLYDKVKQALISEPLLPAYNGSYIPAKKARLARPYDIPEFFSDKQLKELLCTDENIYWLSNKIKEQSGVTELLWRYLNKELGIKIITPETIVESLPKEFLEKQSDDWLINFYGFLIDRPAIMPKLDYLNRPKGIIKDKPIIRLENNTHVVVYRDDGEPNAFLPSEIEYPDYNIVKRNIATSDIGRKFFKEIKFRKIGQKEDLEILLKKNYSSERLEINGNKHLEHMEKFIKYFKENETVKIFKDKFIFIDKNFNSLHQGCDCYIDEPFEQTGLTNLYSMNFDSDYYKNKFALWEKYQKLDGFIEFLKKLEGISKLNIIERSTKEHKNLTKHYKYRYYSTKIDEDFWIPELDKILNLQNFQLSKLVWDTMNKDGNDKLQACYKYNQAYKREYDKSSLAYALKDTEWLPDRHGKFYKPCDMTKDKLPDDFDFNEYVSWLHAVDFGKNEEKQKNDFNTKKKALSMYGFDKNDKNFENIMDIVEALKENSDLALIVKNTIRKNRNLKESNQIELPRNEDINYERRSKKEIERLENAPEKKYVIKPRSVEVSKNTAEIKAFLKVLYTNLDRKMICQICQNEMPFKKRNSDDYYFIARHIFNDSKKEYKGLYLALCPLCDAIYCEYVTYDKDKMQEIVSSIKNIDLTETDKNYFITLDLVKPQQKIFFRKEHLHTLQVFFN